MIPATKHPRENERLEALRRTGVLDTPPQPEFDDIANLASAICGTPIALISLVDEGRQWFKAKVGLAANETSRDVAFCAHAIHGSDVFEVPDARQDPRFADNPLTTSEPHVVFYAGAPLINDDGLPLGTVCVIDHQPRSLTEEQREALRALSRQVMAQLELRRRALELAESEERLHYIVDHAAEVIYNADVFGKFTFVNATAEAIAGLPREQLVGRHFTDLVRPDARKSVLEFYRQQLEQRVRHTYHEFPANFPDGREVWFGQNVQLIYDGDRITGFQAVARDVTEQRRIDEELKHARDSAIESARLKASFLANMSHEIRTPMNGIIGMAGLLTGTDLDADQREIVDTIRTSAEALLSIINDILDFSKIEAGKLSFEIMEFDVRQALEAAVDLVADQAQAKGLEIVAYADEFVPNLVRGDPGRLRQVLTNLLSNAVKFTEKGEIVANVSVASDDADSALLRFEVRDTGVGIAPADQERLFVPFAQADTSSTRKHGGTGLGLAISKQLVEMMGGHLSVESEPGKGSAFRFTARFSRSAEPKERRSLRDSRVLIVEPHVTARQSIARQLQSWNISAEAADSFERSDDFDVVLADARARGVRDVIANGRTKVILMQPIGAKRSSADGAMSITKPVKQSALFDALATLLGDHAEPERRRVAPVEQPVSAHRILIAEDNAVNQKVAVRQLKKLGYSADTVGNGLEAIEALGRIPYDLVLMDCQMPEMDGFSATRLIRGRGKEARRPVIIAMTANALEGDRERCIAAGMDDYISKPVREADLDAILSKWLK
jgi:PAS domain S-box-containing protein